MAPETESPPGSSSADITHSGDLVRIEYDLWSEIGGKSELLDTTHEEVAQSANVGSTEGRTWGPRPHQIGGDYFPTGVESSLVGVRVGEAVEREYAPAEAFGERDPKLIELFSMHEIERLPEMRREDARLDIGTTLTIEGRRGRVISMTAARVRVDFNPPYAGRRVKGTFKVTERITDPVAQVKAILELQYGRASEFHIEHRDKSFTIKLPERSKFDLGWMAAKPRVIDRIRAQIAPKSVKVVEEYVTPAPEKAESPAATPEASAPPEAPKAAEGEKAEHPKHGKAGGHERAKAPASE